MVRRYHPDRNPGDPTAKESFLQVQAAFEALTPRDRDAGFDAERVVSEMRRAAEEAERRRARSTPGGRVWQQIRIGLDRPFSESLQARLETSRAKVGIAAGLFGGAAIAALLAAGLGADSVVSVSLGVALAAVVGTYAVQSAETTPWAVETHWKGLRDLRWGVIVAWTEIRGVRQVEGAVDLALTPNGFRRVHALVPSGVFIEPAVYRLPVRDGSRLIPALRAQLQGGVRLR